MEYVMRKKDGFSEIKADFPDFHVHRFGINSKVLTSMIMILYRSVFITTK